MRLYQVMLFSHVGDYLDRDLERVLRPLGEAINEVNQGINEFAKESGDESEVQLLMDTEGQVIEDFLGMSFVACQTHITRVISSLAQLHKYGERRHLALLTTTSGRVTDMRRFGYNWTASGVSDIEMLNAAANYYKHSDQWDD